MANVDKRDKPGEEESKKSMWKGFGALWTTRQMAGNSSREVEVLITLRELVIYFMFLILLLILSLGMTGTTMFFYTKVMSNLFLDAEFIENGKTNFRTSRQLADFWDFAENSMINGFFWDFWYDRKNPSKKQPVSSRTSLPIASDTKYEKKIIYENKLLGLPRLRQLRMSSSSCIVHKNFRKTMKKCFDFYSPSKEDQKSFGRPGKNTSLTAWDYRTEKDLKGSSYSGLIRTYGGGGFIQDLELDRNKTEIVIQNLKDHLWVDRGTSVIFLDFTVYNANINLFCIIKLVMEFPPTGGLIPSWTFRTVKLLRYVEPMDFFILACEMLFVGFTIYYTLEEIREFMYFKSAYFKNVWNCLDFIILGISYVCIAFSVYRYLEVNNRLYKLLEDADHFEDFSSLSYWQVQYNNWVAICVFFSWIKIFKYISFNKTMSQLSNTLARCARDVLGFAIMFFVVFCAFAQLGYLLFGNLVEAFSSFRESVFTLLRTILGDFDYEAIENANGILGPIFFVMYIFFVFFVLLNMFLAIINDTYSEVKSEIAVRRNEFEVTDFIARGVTNVKTRIGLGKKRKSKDDDEGNVNYDDIWELLRKLNFTDLEIKMFFAKYDVDKDKMLSIEEITKMMKDMGVEPGKKPERGFSLAGNEKSVISTAEFTALDKRINRMETALHEIVDRVNQIVERLTERPPEQQGSGGETENEK